MGQGGPQADREKAHAERTANNTALNRALIGNIAQQKRKWEMNTKIFNIK